MESDDMKVDVKGKGKMSESESDKNTEESVEYDMQIESKMRLLKLYKNGMINFLNNKNSKEIYICHLESLIYFPHIFEKFVEKVEKFQNEKYYYKKVYLFVPDTWKDGTVISSFLSENSIRENTQLYRIIMQVYENGLVVRDFKKYN